MLAAVVGVGYAINRMTQAGATVKVASDLVLDRTGLADNPALTSTPWLGFGSVLVGALLLALAAAFRAGERLTRDMDGLV